MKTKALTFIASTLLSLNAFAVPNGAVGPTTIDRVSNGWAGEQIVITVHDKGPTGCSLGDGFNYSIDTSHPSFKQMVAMALLAYSQKSPVYIWVDTQICVNGQRPYINSIELR